MNSSFKKLSSVIKKAKSIAIFTHINQDEDALGSSVSLGLALKKIGKNAKVFICDKFTDAQEAIFKKDIISFSSCEPNEFDLMISTDVPSKQRMGKYAEVFCNFNNTIMLDHHTTVDLNPTYYYVDTLSSSCSELSYMLIKAMKIKIDKEIATYIYAGLSSDTSSFINSNVNESSFAVALELLKAGADTTKVNEKLYRMKSKKEVELTKYLWNNYVIKKDCAYCVVSFDTLKQLKAKKTDCDSFSRELVSISGVNMSFSLVEIERGLFSLSMRALSGFDVRSIAAKLGGGGHLCASGAKFTAKDIDEAKDMVLKAVFSK